MIYPTPEEQYIKYGQEYFAQFPQPEPSLILPANVQTAVGLLDSGTLYFRGRRYDCPPVPARLAFALQALDAETAALSREVQTVATLTRSLQVLEQAAAIMRTLVRPKDPWERLTWRWRNPFRTATAAEFGALLRFFCSARTIFRVLWMWGSRAPHGWRMIWPPTSPSSYITSRNGSTATAPNAATHFPGVTTWWAA